MQIDQQTKKTPVVRLPEYRNNDAIEKAFKAWPKAIKYLQTILIEQTGSVAVYPFEGEKALDLCALKSLVRLASPGNPVNALLGCSDDVFLMVSIHFDEKSVREISYICMNQLDHTKILLDTLAPSLNIYNGLVILLGDKGFQEKKNYLLRRVLNKVSSFIPLTVEEFYRRVFWAGYQKVVDTDV